jgi:phosphotransferase system enzyme I (PtsI)
MDSANSDISGPASRSEEERVLTGLPASSGIVIGPAYVYVREETYVVERTLDEDEVEREIELLQEAMDRAEGELGKIASFAREKLGDDLAGIFESQIFILRDVELIKALESRIRKERRNADFLIDAEIKRYAAMLSLTADETLGRRVEDISDVGQRLLRNVQKKRLHHSIEGEHIVIAPSLTPVDTLLFSRSDVLGYVTDLGGLTSHTAILARSLKIPAVVATGNAVESIHPEDLVILDGQRGRVIVHPTEETLAIYREKLERIRVFEKDLEGLVELPAVTTDGHDVEVRANAEFVNEIEFVIAQGSNGIGLYRTEHLYISKGEFPTEQEQAIAYSEIAHMMYPQSVLFRTFDIGGDKFIDGWVEEANPFLGWRGIRLLLDLPDEFRRQLRAILRASAMRNVQIMFPMISGVDEIRQAKKHLYEVMDELRAEGVPFDSNLKIGIMIEVPSSVFIADALAREVDFFSIGTNDLTQYLIAVDRNNEHILDLYQEFHPAVLRAIKHVIDTGHANNIKVGMCGEMAGSPLATVLLVGFGLDEFSMAPSVLPEIKKIIRSISVAEARDIADECMKLTSVHDVKALLSEFAQGRYPELAINHQNGGPR